MIELPFLATASPKSTALTKTFRTFSSSMAFGCTLTMPARFKAPNRTAATAACKSALEKNPIARVDAQRGGEPYASWRVTIGYDESLRLFPSVLPLNIR
jgi:hypothetical protein